MEKCQSGHNINNFHSKIILNSKVIVKSVLDPVDYLCRNSKALMGKENFEKVVAARVETVNSHLGY